MRLKFLLLTAPMLICCQLSHAQLNGTYTVPGTYATIAAAVTALNTSGISGAVTISVAAGYAETAPAGGIRLGTTALNASMSATKTLTITKSGAGANPVITAPTGTGGLDIIFTLRGTDYVTINAIDLHESSTNANGVTGADYGYALLNLNAAAPFDGCNNDRIQNCTITLNRTLATPTAGILSSHFIAGNSTPLTITATGDLHSDNKFYGNTITNTMQGIYLQGYNASAPYTLYDQNNDVGGSTPATGNTITNFIGDLYNISLYGIYGINQNNLNISYNTLNQLANGGVSAIGNPYGIYAGGLNANFTINNNAVSLSLAAGGTGFTQYGIYATSNGTTVTASNNRITLDQPSGTHSPSYGIYLPGVLNATITGSRVTQSAAVGSTTANQGITYGILTTALGAVNISTDTVTQTNTAASNSQYLSIATGNVTAVSELIQNNVLLNTSIPTNGSSGQLVLISSATGTPAKTISGNITAGTIVHSGAFGTGANTLGIFLSPSVSINSGTATVFNNKLRNINSSSGNCYGIYYQPSVASTQALNITNDTVSNVTVSNGPFYGIYYGPSVPAAQSVTMSGNAIQNISNSNDFILGVFTSSGGVINITGNTISNFTATSATAVYGIYHYGSNSTTTNILRNRIYDLESASDASEGIEIDGGVTTNVANNLIGNLRSLAANNASTFLITGIAVNSTQANSSINVYYNTVYLNATSSAGSLVSAALTHVTSATATTARLDLRNNILINKSTPGSGGLTSAVFRFGSDFANFAATSDRNLVYAGTPGGSNQLYSDYSNAALTQANYRAVLAPAEAHSVTENSVFASTIGSSASFLHFAPGTTTLAENRAANIAGYSTDFDGNVRQGNTGYTGTGTAPDIGAAEGQYTAANPLAVVLLHFSGKAADDVNNLTWETASEAATDGFVVERSKDGASFAELAAIAAHGKASAYCYVDANPGSGTQYYRLKMAELNGSTTYSQVVALTHTGVEAAAITALPNPVQDHVTLILPPFTGSATVDVLDATGRVVWRGATTTATLRLDMSGYTPGRYLIRMNTGGAVVTGSLIKQ